MLVVRAERAHAAHFLFYFMADTLDFCCTYPPHLSIRILFFFVLHVVRYILGRKEKERMRDFPPFVESLDSILLASAHAQKRALARVRLCPNATFLFRDFAILSLFGFSYRNVR